MPYVQNAPNMMIAPDLAQQQQQLQRQQQIADLLRSQAMQSPDPMQTAAGGVAVKQSPLQGVARLLTAYMAGKRQDDVDAKGLDIAKNYQGRLAALLGGDGGSSAPVNGDIPMVSSDDGSAPAQVPASKGVNLAKYIKGMALGSMYGDDAAKAYYADNAKTDTQKNNDYLGIGAGEARGYEVAHRRKEGMFEAQPGSTTTDLATGAQTFAPKVGEGITLNNGQASAVPGYADANAGIVGAAEKAKAGAGAQYDFVTLTNPDGSTRMVSKAQAAQQANGAPQSVAAPTQFTASNGVKLDFSQMPFGQVAEQAMKSGDPSLLQAVQEYMGSAGKPAQPGIAIQSEAEKAKQVGQVQNNLAIEKSRIENAQSPEQQQKMLDAQSVVELTNNAEKILAAGKATGSTVGTIRDKITGAVGVSTPQSQAAAQLKAIGGALTSKQPKMSGPQSDKDVEQYKEMAGRVGDSSLPIGDRMAALEVVKALNQKYLSQNKDSIAGKAVGANRAGAGTPSVDDLLKHYLKGP